MLFSEERFILPVRYYLSGGGNGRLRRDSSMLAKFITTPNYAFFGTEQARAGISKHIAALSSWISTTSNKSNVCTVINDSLAPVITEAF